MVDFTAERSERRPEVVLDTQSGYLALRGESYPEDAASFFQPIFDGLNAALPEMVGQAFTVDLNLTYFNSSSAKALMNLFNILEQHARSGVSVTVRWHYHQADDAIEEFGQDFAEDFEAARFELCPYADG